MLLLISSTCLYKYSVSSVFTAELHFIDSNPKLFYSKVWLLQWYPSPFKWNSNEREQMIISLHESQSRTQMENIVCRKLEARCDSQVDSHRRCSRATWVRSRNVAPRSAGVLWALRHSPTQCLSTPEGRAGSSLPAAWLSLPGYSDDIVPQLALPANLWPWAAQLCTKATKFF